MAKNKKNEETSNQKELQEIYGDKEFKHQLDLFSLKNDDTKLIIRYTEDVNYIELFNTIDAIIAVLNGDDDIDYTYYEPILNYNIFKLFTSLPIESLEDAMETELAYGVKRNLMQESAYIAYCIELIEKSVWRQLDYYKAIHTNKKMNNFVDTLNTVLISVFGNSFTEKTGMNFSEMLEEFISKEAEQFTLELKGKGNDAE